MVSQYNVNKDKGMSEFTKEDRERIVKLEVGVAALVKSFDEYKEVATSQVGFPRCAVHTEKLERIENSAKWLGRTVVGAIIIGVVGTVIGWISP
jgi:hypothetical protein